MTDDAAAERRAHWANVHRGKSPLAVSWHQESPALRLEESRTVEHTTPAGSIQRFQFSRFRRLSGLPAEPAPL